MAFLATIKHQCAVVSAAVLSVCVFAVGAQSADISPDVDKIKHLIDLYATSVSEADTALAARIWSNSSDVSFIHPLGHEHGFDQVKHNVYERAMGRTFSERKLSIHDVTVHVYGEAAWAEFYWDFVAKVRATGLPATTKGSETQVYRKEAGGWRLVHVHYSAMPVKEAQ